MIFQFRVVTKLIGAAGQDEADGVFEIVAVADKIIGEPVEQFGMARRLIEAKIIDRREEADAEVTFPKAVDDGFGKAWIGGVNEQLGEAMQAFIHALGQVVRDTGEVEGKFGRDDTGRFSFRNG